MYLILYVFSGLSVRVRGKIFYWVFIVNMKLFCLIIVYCVYSERKLRMFYENKVLN